MSWLAIKGWVAENISWLAFPVMCFVGATVGFFRGLEKSEKHRSLKHNILLYIAQLFYASFIGLCVFFLYPMFGISQPIAFVVSGILCLFGGQTIDRIYDNTWQRIEKRGQKDDGK